MKLKTLKDLELGIGDHEKIRQEAIKCIVYGVKKRKNFFRAFCDFFDITTEDLK